MTGVTIRKATDEPLRGDFQVTERVYTDKTRTKACGDGSQDAKFLVAPVGPVSRPKAQEIHLLRGGDKFLRTRGGGRVSSKNLKIDELAAPDDSIETPNTLKRFRDVSALQEFAKSIGVNIDTTTTAATRPAITKAILDHQEAAKQANTRKGVAPGEQDPADFDMPDTHAELDRFAQDNAEQHPTLSEFVGKAANDGWTVEKKQEAVQAALFPPAE